MKKVVALSVGLAAGLAVHTADAENLIRQPGAHTMYAAELEPHLVLEFPEGVGLGARATFPIAQTGFIERLNDSVGIGVGGDVSTEGEIELMIPVVMQWNFWFTRQWSAFGEVGPTLRVGDGTRLNPNIGGGGRLQFNSSLALTLRAGWPLSTIGVSFFL